MPQKIKTTITKIQTALADVTTKPDMENGNLAFTGAKMYYKGGGWWLISGYAWDKRDEELVVDFLKAA